MLSFRSLRPLGAAAIALLVLDAGSLRAAPPSAPSPPPAAATVELDEHVAQGRRLYQLGQYQAAIAEFRRAYELKAEPRFLEQIAEAYRQLGGTEQALFYYDRYLAASPDAPDRAAVEVKVAELESVRAAPPASPAASAAITAPGIVVSSPRPAARPVWRRWWFWTAVGVLAVATGITAAVLATRTETSVPPSELGDGKFY